MTTNEPLLGATWKAWYGYGTSHPRGGDLPEDEGTPVFVQFRDGTRSQFSRPVEAWIWTWSQSSADTLRYAVDRGSRQRDDEVRFRKVAGQQDHYSPAELRAFNAGRAFAERIACAEQNARCSAVLRIAVEARAELDADAEDLRLELHEIVRTIDPHLAELSCADARRALNALQPD